MNDSPHATTILWVRGNGIVCMGGDGQVTSGNTVMKGNARKVRRLYDGKVLGGFAGGTADAFTLFERFEGQAAEARQPHARRHRAGEGLAQSTGSPRRLEALLRVAVPRKLVHYFGQRRCHRDRSTICIAIGSGGAFAQSAATCPVRRTPSSMPARSLKSRLNIAADICIYTNRNFYY